MSCTPAKVSRCVLQPATDPSPTPAANVLTELDGERFLSVHTVMGWLTEAAASSSVTITSQTRTIAGAHSTCVNVTGAENSRVSSFEACVTDTGLLGSFSGDVDGQPRSVILTSISSTVDPDVFTIPDEVAVIDERTSSPT